MQQNLWFTPLSLLVACSALASCDNASRLEGFKEIDFGTTQDDLQALGFACDLDGDCRMPSAEVVASITPELISQSNPDLGAQQFSRCIACHAIEQRGPAGIGPDLWGVVGTQIAESDSNFPYSDALKAKRGRWDIENMNAFLASPRTFASGTTMAFAGVSRVEDRANLIAYLNCPSSDKMRQVGYSL